MHDMMNGNLPEWLKKAPIYNPDPRGAARALRPIIEAGAAEAERTAQIPESVVRALADAGIWGLFVPRELGGMEVDPDTYIDVIEQLSYADGSVGWVVMATTYCIHGNSSLLGPSAIEAMFKNGEGYISAGHIGPLSKAERVEGGYRIWGTQQFGSGSQVASWFIGCFVLQKDGKPDLGPDGKPQMVWAVAPRSRVRLRGNWDVMGLRATGSCDFEFLEQFVSEEFILFPPPPTHRGGAIYDVPVTLGHVAWVLGVGMRVIDEIKQIAKHKRRQNRVTLIDQTTFQRDFAEATAALEAARALVRSAFNNWFEAAKRGKPSLEVRANGRLAGCWATETVAKVGRFAYLAAGSDGLRNADGNNVLQRCFRDLHAGAIHRHIDHNVAIDCGATLLGVNAPDVQL
jgi:alkylation response protein AidB-like acyl-CoA dehydrogenase